MDDLNINYKLYNFCLLCNQTYPKPISKANYARHIQMVHSEWFKILQNQQSGKLSQRC